MADPLCSGTASRAMITIGAAILDIVHTTAICSQPGIDLISPFSKRFFISTAGKPSLYFQMGSSKIDTGKLYLI